MSYNGNEYYTRIRSRGTAGAFESSPSPVSEAVSPFKTIDVLVNVANLTSSGPLVILDYPIEPGCVVLYTSIDGAGSISDSAFTADVGYANAALNADPNVPTLFTQLLDGTAPEIPGLDINDGQVAYSTSYTISAPLGLAPVFPVLKVTGGGSVPRVGTVRVKMVIFSP